MKMIIISPYQECLNTCDHKFSVKLHNNKYYDRLYLTSGKLVLSQFVARQGMHVGDNLSDTCLGSKEET